MSKPNQFTTTNKDYPAVILYEYNEEANTVTSTEPETPRTLIVLCYPIEKLAGQGNLERVVPALNLAYSNDYRVLHDRVIQGSDGKSYHFLIAQHRNIGYDKSSTGGNPDQ